MSHRRVSDERLTRCPNLTGRLRNVFVGFFILTVAGTPVGAGAQTSTDAAEAIGAMAGGLQKRAVERLEETLCLTTKTETRLRARELYDQLGLDFVKWVPLLHRFVEHHWYQRTPAAYAATAARADRDFDTLEKLADSVRIANNGQLADGFLVFQRIRFQGMGAKLREYRIEADSKHRAWLAAQYSEMRWLPAPNDPDQPTCSQWRR